MTSFVDAPLALAGGLLTIVSPCVLPILPIILGATFHREDRTRPLFIVTGFIISFSALGMLLASVNQQIVTVHETLRHIGIAMLAVTGLAMLWKRPYVWLLNKLNGMLRHLVPKSSADRTGKLGGLLLGMSLGAVWTPCAGPVLASILILVAKADDFGWSSTLLFLYACGAAIPMLLIAYGGGFVHARIRVLARYTDYLQRVFGGMILTTAGVIYLQYDVLIYARLADFLSL